MAVSRRCHSPAAGCTVRPAPAPGLVRGESRSAAAERDAGAAVGGIPRERLFVDFAGHVMEVIDPATGEIQRAEIFVAVLGALGFETGLGHISAASPRDRLARSRLERGRRGSGCMTSEFSIRGRAECPASMERKMDLCRTHDNAASLHGSYARDDEVSGIGCGRSEAVSKANRPRGVGGLFILTGGAIITLWQR
jgi:hypothetical protein